MKNLFARAGVVIAVALLIACSGGTDDKGSCDLVADLPGQEAASPAGRLDLSHWILTVPVDAAGGTTGQADTIQTDELLAGYSSDWFYATDDGGVAFRAPVDGAKTPSSQYARSELREVLDPTDHTVNWLPTQTATMTAELAVSQTASATRKIIVGKIVGFGASGTDLTALVHLIYFIHGDTCKASLYGLVSDAPTAGSPTRQLMLIENGLELNDRFDYSIAVNNGTLTLRSGASEASTAIDPSWNDVEVYFRAGAGLNAAGADPADGASATFYDLVVTH
jgi:hypothetical protein